MLFLWAENVGEIVPPDALGPLLAIVAAAALATAVLGLLLGDLRRGALIVTPVVVGAFLFGHLLEALALQVDPLLIGWALLIVAGVLGALFLGRRALANVDRALFVMSAILVGISFVTIVPHHVEEALTPRHVMAADRDLPTATSAPKRDVYWLVFDRYGSDRSFELQFGVRNDLTAWLRDRDFTVLPDSHANYGSTALSLATTLNMTHLEDLVGPEYADSNSYSRVNEAMQDSPVVRQFQALDYRYVHLGSWWNPTRTDTAADVNLNADSGSDFTDVLAATSALPTLMEKLALETEPPSESVKHLKHNTFGLAALDRIIGEAGPKFVFAHVLLPHPPYIYDRDGRYLDPDEQATLTTADLWERQLTYTNGRLRAFLERLLALPEDERPIIVLQADEGPWTDRYGADKVDYDWAAATPEELEIKFGILNAWYVPGGEDLGLDPAMTAINTFRTLFRGYFGIEEYSPLPDRVSTSAGWWRPYRLTDVTERLPSLR